MPSIEKEGRVSGELKKKKSPIALRVSRVQKEIEEAKVQPSPLREIRVGAKNMVEGDCQRKVYSKTKDAKTKSCPIRQDRDQREKG